MLHQQSPRKNQLFVAINCAAIPAELMESELFGHEKGAFSGAIKSRTGKFELANGGTLFLDEITEMPIHLQAKLLRALQEGVIEKVGDNRKISLDLRIVAATNINPLDAVQVGKLREDLYYRLNVFQLNVPPLRDRIGDISILAKHFALVHKADVSEDAISALEQYQWTGNVRELQNVMERAAIICKNRQIKLADLPKDIIDARNLSLHISAGPALNSFSIPEAVALIEKKLISEALLECQGNKAKAARLMDISERSLWNKLDFYHLK